MQDVPNLTEIPEPVRNMMKATIDQTRKAFETFISASQQAMSGFDTNGSQPMDGMKQLNEKIAEFTRQNADANFRFAMQLADAKKMNEVVDMQSTYVRELMDTYGKQLEEIRTLTTKLVQDGTQAATTAAQNMQDMSGGGSSY
ncbi:MAG: phasin family protein [Hyphomicrobiales bacterium]|nr:phasin family protein [Hyphomicrobiales bacterium]